MNSDYPFWDDVCLRGSIDGAPLPAPPTSLFDNDLFCDETAVDDPDLGTLTDLLTTPTPSPPLLPQHLAPASPSSSFTSSLPANSSSPPPATSSPSASRSHSSSSSSSPPSSGPSSPARSTGTDTATHGKSSTCNWRSFLDDNCPLRKRVKVTIVPTPPTASASASGTDKDKDKDKETVKDKSNTNNSLRKRDFPFSNCMLDKGINVTAPPNAMVVTPPPLKKPRNSQLRVSAPRRLPPSYLSTAKEAGSASISLQTTFKVPRPGDVIVSPSPMKRMKGLSYKKTEAKAELTLGGEGDDNNNMDSFAQDDMEDGMEFLRDLGDESDDSVPGGPLPMDDASQDFILSLDSVSSAAVTRAPATSSGHCNNIDIDTGGMGLTVNQQVMSSIANKQKKNVGGALKKMKKTKNSKVKVQKQLSFGSSSIGVKQEKENMVAHDNNIVMVARKRRAVNMNVKGVNSRKGMMTKDGKKKGKDHHHHACANHRSSRPQQPQQQQRGYAKSKSLISAALHSRLANMKTYSSSSCASTAMVNKTTTTLPLVDAAVEAVARAAREYSEKLASSFAVRGGMGLPGGNTTSMTSTTTTTTTTSSSSMSCNGMMMMMGGNKKQRKVSGGSMSSSVSANNRRRRVLLSFDDRDVKPLVADEKVTTESVLTSFLNCPSPCAKKVASAASVAS